MFLDSFSTLIYVKTIFYLIYFGTFLLAIASHNPSSLDSKNIIFITNCIGISISQIAFEIAHEKKLLKNRSNSITYQDSLENFRRLLQFYISTPIMIISIEKDALNTKFVNKAL